MKTITILFPALICVFGLTGCVPAPGASGPGRPIAAYIADDVTKAEITHRAGGTVTEWTAEGDELDALKDWASGLKYELLDSEENPGDRDGGEVYEVVLTEGRSLPLADAERAAVNAVLEKYITLGLGIVENVG